MENFLQEAKQNINNLDDSSKVHVVMGNESGDLDSVISALVYGFYLSNIKTSDHSIVVPILNMPEEDYALHTEVTYFLQEHGINSGDLCFRNQVDLHSLNQDGRLSLTLVDHNVLPAADGPLDGAVVEVIDHHQKDRPDSENVAVTIEMVGSCCTLVFEKLSSDDNFQLDEKFASVLFGPIILDTVCLSPEAGRATPKDEAAVAKIEEMLTGVDRQKVFDSLQNAKADISDLNTQEILRKDLKVVSSDAMTIAVSSVPMHIEDFLKRSQVEEDLEQFCGHQRAHVVVVMTLCVTENNVPQRQIAVYSQNASYREQICAVLQSTDNPALELLPYPTTTSHKATASFQQQNVKASRKKILPLLKAFLAQPRSN